MMLEYLKRVKEAIEDSILKRDGMTIHMLQCKIRSGDMPDAYYETCNLIKQIECDDANIGKNAARYHALQNLEQHLDFNNAAKPNE